MLVIFPAHFDIGHLFKWKHFCVEIQRSIHVRYSDGDGIKRGNRGNNGCRLLRQAEACRELQSDQKHWQESEYSSDIGISHGCWKMGFLNFSAQMVAHPQSICHDSQCRIDSSAGREEAGVHDIEIIYIMRLAISIER